MSEMTVFDETCRPDDPVVDLHGNLWCAQFGYGKVSPFASEGNETGTIAISGRNSSCASLGGPDLKSLYITSMWHNRQNPGGDGVRTFIISFDVAAREKIG